MTKKEQIEIVIAPDGRVDLHLEGFGKRCDEYIKMFAEILNGKIEDKKYKAEYYSDTQTDNQIRTRR